jgi:hypothetical protein
VTGAPVKATVQPPNEGYIANAHRKSNPFTADIDWVESSTSSEHSTTSCVQIGRKPMLPPRRDTLGSSTGSTSPQSVKSARLPPAVPRKPLSLSSQTKAQTMPTMSNTQGSRQGSLGSTNAASSPPDLLGDSSSERIGWKPLLQ